jgi:hypothetical protein
MSGDHERKNNAAAAAATTALLNSWMVPADLVAESSSGFAMVIDQVSISVVSVFGSKTFLSFETPLRDSNR